ncbi:MAG: hypothetical protein KGI93_09065, partial [Acidobacteriota bacterium]|nr:hypothetical protein [Acidobacteriota bacterium]
LVAAAGVMASVAVAKPPSGHGNPHNRAGSTTGTTTTGTTGTTTTSGRGKGKKAGTVLVCHKTGNGKYVLVRVSANSALAKGKHAGDVLAVGGTCPGPIQGHTGTGTDEQGTTTTTTTSTTSSTTTTTAATTTS